MELLKVLGKHTVTKALFYHCFQTFGALNLYLKVCFVVLIFAWTWRYQFITSLRMILNHVWNWTSHILWSTFQNSSYTLVTINFDDLVACFISYFHECIYNLFGWRTSRKARFIDVLEDFRQNIHLKYSLILLLRRINGLKHGVYKLRSNLRKVSNLINFFDALDHDHSLLCKFNLRNSLHYWLLLLFEFLFVNQIHLIEHDA